MDLLFKALNDATRRALLDALSRKDGQSLQELEETADMTRFGIMKHLKVLEDAGLIVPVKKGRFKYHYLNAVPLQDAMDRWIDPLLSKPAARTVLTLKTHLEGAAVQPALNHPDADAKPDFVNRTYIRCTQDALWDAITDPEAVQHYHFMAAGAEMRDGKMVFLMPDGSALMSQAVLETTPKTRAVSTFEPHWDPEAVISRVVYYIEVEGATCCLTIEHFGLQYDAQSGVADGWARWAAGLKTWLETGQDAHFGSRAGSV